MKLFSIKAELKAIRTITTSAEGLSSLAMSTLDKSFFHYEPALEAYNRIVTIAKKRGEIVTFHDLLEDPALNEDFRDLIRESKPAYCKSEKSVNELINLLDKYRKVRLAYEMAKDIFTTVKGTDVDIDALLDKCSQALLTARSGDALARQMRIIGKDANALDLVDEALSRAVEVLYKTGIAEYDEKSGGMPADGVALLAGTTSGGKSVILMNLLTNIYKLNKVNVCNVSLEMSDKKQTRRLLSHLTKIPFEKFAKQTLSKEERKMARKYFKRLHAYGEENDCRYAMLNPTNNVTINQLLMLVKPFGFQVIGIDYASLLDTSGEKEQWKALGEIARQCKIFATANKCLIILLVQLDSADDHIRYSQALLEHADNAWAWNYSKPEVRDTHVINMKQLKARDAELYNFDLAERFDIMTVSSQGFESKAADADSNKSSEDGDDGEGTHPALNYDETGSS